MEIYDAGLTLVLECSAILQVVTIILKNIFQGEVHFISGSVWGAELNGEGPRCMQ